MRGFFLVLIGLSPLVFADDCGTKATGTAESELVERINRRYDDFFRYRRARDEWDERLRNSREDRKGVKELNERNMEKARREYVKTRRPKVDYDAVLEAQQERERKEQLKKMEVARRCYVRERARAEQVLKRGRTIPELKEYDLEEYY